MKTSILDAHCDLLYHLTRPNVNPHDKDLGCAIPYLKEGNVKLQVMAIFSKTQENSHEVGIKQSKIFNELNTKEEQLYVLEKEHVKNLHQNKNIGMLASIENASAFCDESMSLKEGFKNFEIIRNNVGNIFYVGFTHHTENRFGGGNATSIGLKDDGKALIDFLDHKNIAIDFAHTSDKLAYDILDYLSKQNLNIPIIASHSNFRNVFEHPRNLPDEIAQEIIQKRGLIGMNFLRAYVSHENPDALYDHIDYGLTIGAKDAICFGADYFYTKAHPDKSRIPFYFEAHENATCYQDIATVLAEKFGTEISDNISYQNFINFLNRLWG